PDRGVWTVTGVDIGRYRRAFRRTLADAASLLEAHRGGWAVVIDDDLVRMRVVVRVRARRVAELENDVAAAMCQLPLQRGLVGDERFAVVPPVADERRRAGELRDDRRIAARTVLHLQLDAAAHGRERRRPFDRAVACAVVEAGDRIRAG